MLIRKTAGFFLAALLLAASALGIVAAFPSRTATADAPATLTTDNASLFLPDSYEQYLALDSPVDVAVGEKYIAVADKDALYVYDRAGKSYSKTELQNEGDTITKIGFAGNRLFVSTREGTGNQCYEYDFEVGASNRLRKLEFNCSTFCINGNMLYAATVGGQQTTITSYPLSTVSTQHPSPKNLGALGVHTTPSMTLLNGILYCTVNDQVYYYDLNGNGNSDAAQSFYLSKDAPGEAKDVQSACAHNGVFYYTAAGGLYRIELAEGGHSSQKAVCILKESGLGALTSFGDALYAVKGNAVCRIDFDGETAILSDYEISAASASTNRLNGATECVRAGNLLVTADVNNDRVSVYDTAEKRFVTLSCANVKSVATDGTIIAAATDTGISIFEKVLNSETLVWEFSCTKAIQASNVVGVVCVYDAIYYITSDYNYGKIERGDDGWISTSKQRGLGTTPKAITADLFGDIYVAANDGKVYEFSENDFTVGNDLGSTVAEIGSDFSSLRAGFDGKLYYLDENKNLCVNDGAASQTVASIDGAAFVYAGGAEKKPVSFALGYEDDEVYFCFGDFIVKSNAGELTKLGLATLETLSQTVLNEAEETLTAVADAENVRLVDCNPGAVGVHGNLSALQGGGAFAAGYKRYTEARRGVVLDGQDDYRLVAVYDGHVYTAEIFRNEDVGEPFSPKKEDGENAVMYLSSDCPAYHFPCIAEAPARAGTLARGTRVTVISYLDGNTEEGGVQGGYPFAYIEYETKTRSVARGYVPVSYLTDADPLGDTETRYTLGYVKPGATFTGSDGSEVVNEERVQARLYQNEDGTYTATYEKDGVSYTATVEEGQIEWGESDAWRIALIVILSVVAVLIIGGYVFLIPWNKKRTK